MSYLSVQYDEKRQPRTYFPRRLAYELMARGLWVNGMKTLDVGCGRGDFTRALGADGLDQEGEARWRCCADSYWPMAESSYDVVFSKSLIEHLDRPLRMLEEARRALRPGGRIIVMTPDWRTYQETFWDDYTHVRPYDVVSMADMLRVSGFRSVRAEVMYQYPACWAHPELRWLFSVWRAVVPLRFSLWLCDKTGWTWPKWASQLTVLATGIKP